VIQRIAALRPRLEGAPGDALRPPRVAAGLAAASFSPRREAAIGLGVYAVYLVVRQLAVTERGERAAPRNARAIVALERRLGLHVEPRLQRALLGHPRAVAVANASYVTLNVGLTVGWLALLFVRRDVRFHRLRRAWAIATLGAQPAYLLLPTAPPRGLDGFVDTIRESGIDLDHGVVARLYNPIAAMPSIHVAYAVVIGAAVSQTAQSRVVRWSGPAYAPLVAGVVLATGNHFVLDVAAGALLGAASLRLAGRPPSERTPADEPAAADNAADAARLAGVPALQGRAIEPEEPCASS
jgi:hypothetical protein